MLRNLFFFNVFVTLGFGLQLALSPDFFMTNLGWQQVSDEAEAVAFIWGSAVQTGIAATQYTTSSAAVTSPKALIAHGKVHAFWWTAFGLAFYSRVPELAVFSIANIAFMLGYGALYGFYSFVQPPKQD